METLDTRAETLDIQWNGKDFDRKISQLPPEKKRLRDEDKINYLRDLNRIRNNDSLFMTTFSYFHNYIGAIRGIAYIVNKKAEIGLLGRYISPNNGRMHSKEFCSRIGDVINKDVIKNPKIQIYKEIPPKIMKTLIDKKAKVAFSNASLLQVPLFCDKQGLSGTIIIYKFGEQPIPQLAREFGEFISEPFGEAIMRNP